jgi:hypothetical protein
MKRYVFFLIILALTLASCGHGDGKRRIISLNGVWQIAKTEGQIPSEWKSLIPVPGLVDLADPALDAIVLPTTDAPDGSNRPFYGYMDGWYWHRRMFEVDDTDFSVIRLKIFKARYHTKVYINGQFAGENLYCFTPSYFDLKPFLHEGRNEIVIGVGCLPQMPDTIPNGRDYEKLKYIPGIYDNVEITFSNNPFIRNIQCAPDPEISRLYVSAEIETRSSSTPKLHYSVSDVKTGSPLVAGDFKENRENLVISQSNSEPGVYIATFNIDMTGAKKWTPQTPNLYQLTLSTSEDEKTERFGMRSFRFDPDKKVAMLNDEPHFLRGTNVCIYRFFEDPDRSTLPWDNKWVTTLHERFKNMNWEIARYCIGFPPERWYEICDSLGFMIQDEYPLWGEFNFSTGALAEEYRRWMRERWNHPSVIIWDAQNETVTPLTANAFRQVRKLDLSNRPWDNGWGLPDRPTDPIEAHPYLFNDYWFQPDPPEGYKKELFDTVRPAVHNSAISIYKSNNKKDTTFTNPLVINEYGWIWLNRDGSTTTLTDGVYKNLWHDSLMTTQQRFHIYARHLAILTEYWRAHRQTAGVLHFCGLGYSRPKAPRGQTSDHFIDIRNLTFEPEFERLVKPAFAPVGVMIDLWEKSYPPRSKVKVPVYVVNDTPSVFDQDIVLSISLGGKDIAVVRKHLSMDGFNAKIAEFNLTMPEETGNYILKAQVLHESEIVFSERDLIIADVESDTRKRKR